MNYDSLPSDCLSALSGLLRCQGDARTRVHIVPGREEDVVQHVDDVRNQGTDERSDPKLLMCHPADEAYDAYSSDPRVEVAASYVERVEWAALEHNPAKTFAVIRVKLPGEDVKTVDVDVKNSSSVAVFSRSFKSWTFLPRKVNPGGSQSATWDSEKQELTVVVRLHKT